LFYAHGVRAVGIDRIVAESGVGKMSLYRHFRTKDDLVVAVLQHRDAAALAGIEALAKTGGKDARDQLQAVFDKLEHAVDSPAWHGCAFANTALELHDPDHPARRVAEEHKTRTTALFERLARHAGATDPHGLAAQLTLLLDGAMVAVQIHADPAAARPAAQAARALITAHLS
jgi:AcrR family transcriptional regulator